MTFHSKGKPKGIRYRFRIGILFVVFGGFLTLFLLTADWTPDHLVIKLVLIVGVLLATFCLCVLFANGLIKLEQLDEKLFGHRQRKERVDND
ncbi:hypothetical protein D1823_14050 [Ruegeria sp. AD91A]|nr:hypothetical protein D1823_14050 [Ruegeria sp. AD91A]